MDKSFSGTSDPGAIYGNPSASGEVCNNRKGDFTMKNKSINSNVSTTPGEEMQMTEQESYALAQAYLNGDMGAWDTLYRAALPKVQSFVESKIVPGPLHDEVDDIMQDTFLTAWQNIGKFNGKSAFSTFVNGIAHKIILKPLEKEKRRRKILGLRVCDSADTEDEDMPGIIDQIEDTNSDWDPLLACERQDTRDKTIAYLWPAFDKLAPKQKQALELREIEGVRSFKEIGERMDSNDDAAEQAYRAAKTMLPKKAEKLGLGTMEYGKRLYKESLALA